MFSYQWLAALTALEELTINPLQREALSYVTSTRLAKLRLSAIANANLQHIRKFTSLRALDIHDLSNTNRVDPTDLQILSNLISLRLFVKCAELVHLPNLEELALICLDIKNAELIGVQNLTSLVVHANYDSDAVDASFIPSLTALKQLTLRLSQHVSCQFFSPLLSLNSLTVGKMENDFDRLSVLTNLTTLCVSNSHESPKLLQLPTTLQHLDIFLIRPATSDTISIHIAQRLPYLHRLAIHTTVTH